MNIGLKLWSVNTDSYLSEARRLFSECVFEYLELFAVPETLDTLEEWKKFEVPYVIHSPHFATGFNLADTRLCERNMAVYAQTKEFADTLNAKYIIFHGGTGGTAGETARQLELINDTRALIENKPKLPLLEESKGCECRGHTPDEISYIMHHTGCGFCLDFGHAVAAANALGENPYDYMEEFMKLGPSMFHLSDMEDAASPLDSHEHLGEGNLDIGRIAGLLPRGAMVSIETKKDFKDSLSDFKKDAEYLRRLA